MAHIAIVCPCGFTVSALSRAAVEAALVDHHVAAHFPLDDIKPFVNTTKRPA